MIFIILNIVLYFSIASSFASSRLSLADFRLIMSSINLVNSKYVDNIDKNTIIEYAIKGMLEKLDPHSTYLSPKTYTRLLKSVKKNNNIVGIGAEVTIYNGFIKIVTPLDYSPSKKAGLEAGDLIFKINGKVIKGISLSDGIALLKGRAGTRVKVSVIKANSGGKKEDIIITRNKITLNSSSSKMLKNNIAYLRIPSFKRNTHIEVQKELKRILYKKPKGLIIDLRNNPGGVVKSSVKTIDLFLDNKKYRQNTIVKNIGKNKKVRYIGKITNKDMTNNIPIIVLINSASASAAEIMSSALKDYGRALIIGDLSFGKGTVQSIIPLTTGGAIKMTTGRYYSPKGYSIQGLGVSPDILIKDKKYEVIREGDLKGIITNKKKVITSTSNNIKRFLEAYKKSNYKINKNFNDVILSNAVLIFPIYIKSLK